MATKRGVDETVRERLRKHLIYYMRTHRRPNGKLPTLVVMAKEIGCPAPHLSQILSGDRLMGFEVFLKFRRLTQWSADALLDHDPPDVYEPAVYDREKNRA